MLSEAKAVLLRKLVAHQVEKKGVREAVGFQYQFWELQLTMTYLSKEV
jgi:hypothetical protein